MTLIVKSTRHIRLLHERRKLNWTIDKDRKVEPNLSVRYQSIIVSSRSTWKMINLG
jgi:hypothetical protein